MLAVKVRRRAVVAGVDRPLREALAAARLLVVDLDRAAEAALLVQATAAGRKKDHLLASSSFAMPALRHEYSSIELRFGEKP